MDEKDDQQIAGSTDKPKHEDSTTVEAEAKHDKEADKHENDVDKQEKLRKKTKCRKPEHRGRKHVKKSGGAKASKDDVDSDSSSESDSDSEGSSDASSADAAAKKSKSSKAKKIKKAKGKKQKRKSKKQVDDSESDSSDDEDSDSSDSSSSSADVGKKRKSKSAKSTKQSKDKKARKTKKAVANVDSEESAAESDAGSDDEATGVSMKDLQQQLALLKLQITSAAQKQKSKSKRSSLKTSKGKTKATKQKASSHFKRVDQVWDAAIRNYKLKESAEDDASEFEEFAFLVRRTFDWENKYRHTIVDIKSKQLRAALSEVMKDCKSVSLEAEEPVIDPNILFLYLEALRTYCKKTLKVKVKAEKKRKVAKKLEQQRSLVKSLISYIDEDYAETKKTLYPLLKAGNITFDLLWALFHPNDIAITSSYGVWDEPRCFKIDYANKYQLMSRGEWYCIEGRYLEYDGKPENGFGFGNFEVDIDGFKGPRKITSLATYPLKYHKDPEKVRKQIVERGERFVNMEGMHYKFHKGLAFMKKKKQVLKINVNGRAMIDPATFRRVNPNYPISWIAPKEDDELVSFSDDDGSECGCSCGADSDNEDAIGEQDGLDNYFDEDRAPKYKYKWAEDERGHTTFLAVEVDDDGDEIRPQHVDKLTENPDLQKRSFTEEELLLTSPVVLGFAFSEKLWLEFTISGVHDITYNEDAFDSLVLPPNQKAIVRAMVESHKFHGAKTIDDVVQGKGKGLVTVLHGPPGTGKTLTAEGIAELLKCPLYMVSAGELGTDAARLEHSLQQILDIAHSWGAVLLLDEADVFLEKREVHDIHRNALVSVFLRLLEYFQGILFLTTNRVNTFDEAFQSRIHVALRYGELTHKAKMTVWKMFLTRVRNVEGMEVEELSDDDLDILSRNQLNGRQIKNLVRTAQALALNQKQKLTMKHIKQVLDVAETFDRDLKGGTGYIDAMRSYT